MSADGTSLGVSSVSNLILGTMTFGAQTSKLEAADQLRYFQTKSYHLVDTARMYCHGLTEEILGELLTEAEHGIDASKLYIATKVNAFPDYNKSLSPENVRAQSDAILSALKATQTSIFYLHAPDVKTPIEDTLAAVQALYLENRFVEFGLSNYAAWEVVYIHGYCLSRGWITPTVYQGMYNVITRDLEKELIPALRKLNMKLYIYNPLCGGILTGKHIPDDVTASAGTRFDLSNTRYRERYWKDEYFRATDMIKKACEKHNLGSTECSLRWLVHHSLLSGTHGDGIILGASKLPHLVANIEACEGGPLPDDVVCAMDEAWKIARPFCPPYFRL